jgi:hypothetical protein
MCIAVQILKFISRLQLAYTTSVSYVWICERNYAEKDAQDVQDKKEAMAYGLPRHNFFNLIFSNITVDKLNKYQNTLAARLTQQHQQQQKHHQQPSLLVNMVSTRGQVMKCFKMVFFHPLGCSVNPLLQC